MFYCCHYQPQPFLHHSSHSKVRLKWGAYMMAFVSVSLTLKPVVDNSGLRAGVTPRLTQFTFSRFPCYSVINLFHTSSKLFILLSCMSLLPPSFHFLNNLLFSLTAITDFWLIPSNTSSACALVGPCLATHWINGSIELYCFSMLYFTSWCSSKHLSNILWKASLTT